jgi:hypothetical protein
VFLGSAFSRFLFLAVLAAGVAIAPLRIAAQDSAPAAKSQPAAGETANPQPAQSDEEQQSNAFRLEGPLVKASAKALNLSVEATARIFEFINFSIVVLAIGIPLFASCPSFFASAPGRCAPTSSRRAR